GGHRQSLRRQVRRDLGQVVAVVLHLLGFAQLQLIEIARGPSVGDVDEMQLGSHLHGELPHVVENRVVRGRMLDRDKNPAIHHQANICTSSQVLSAAMITATVQASTRTHPGATKGPSFALSPVKITSGKTANDN